MLSGRMLLAPNESEGDSGLWIVPNHQTVALMLGVDKVITALGPRGDLFSGAQGHWRLAQDRPKINDNFAQVCSPFPPPAQQEGQRLPFSKFVIRAPQNWIHFLGPSINQASPVDLTFPHSNKSPPAPSYHHIGSLHESMISALCHPKDRSMDNRKQ